MTHVSTYYLAKCEWYDPLKFHNDLLLFSREGHTDLLFHPAVGGLEHVAVLLSKTTVKHFGAVQIQP